MVPAPPSAGTLPPLARRLHPEADTMTVFSPEELTALRPLQLNGRDGVGFAVGHGGQLR